ncbi:MAG: NAD(P)H-hydrate dehydratase [Clostridia bacterium]|nr:NAD(P)H-hydrate dehydratase [Clostridia bacterium]
MERILSVEQMRSADEYTINNLGLTREILTERAGLAVANEIKKRLFGGRVLVCIGKGHNGDDGKVIAKALSLTHGFTVATMTVANGIFKVLDKKFDIIVDCIFGTGLNRNVEGKYKTAIEKINSSGAYVVSCDIASGLNGNTGKVMGVAVKANLTVAIQEYKLGHFLGDGPDYSGEVVAKDIGISIWGDDYANRLTGSDSKKFFEQRKRNVHKGCFGKTLIIGGSKKYSGSAILSLNALTSLKMGNGYANILIPKCLFNSVCGLNPECIISECDEEKGYFKFNESILRDFLKTDSIAVGMGMGVTSENYKIICYLLKNYTGRLLIDADGLNTLSKYGKEVLKDKKCEVVITPHIGEFATISKTKKEDIISDPITNAKSFAKEYGVVVLLKSAVSVITDGKQVYLNTTGNCGMAKAGSGDVLSGILCGLLARKKEFFDCVTTASFIFGKAGEEAVRKANEYTVTAMDFVNALPQVINDLD